MYYQKPDPINMLDFLIGLSFLIEMNEHHFVILEEPAEELGAQGDLVCWYWGLSEQFQILSAKHLRNFNKWREDLIVTDLD